MIILWPQDFSKTKISKDRQTYIYKKQNKHKTDQTSTTSDWQFKINYEY